MKRRAIVQRCTRTPYSCQVSAPSDAGNGLTTCSIAGSRRETTASENSVWSHATHFRPPCASDKVANHFSSASTSTEAGALRY